MTGGSSDPACVQYGVSRVVLLNLLLAGLHDVVCRGLVAVRYTLVTETFGSALLRFTLPDFGAQPGARDGQAALLVRS
jgi:hypothetical protein